MNMTFAEAKAIRAEIVNGIRKEWKKIKANPWDMAANAIPNSHSARLYWKARNASQGVMRNLANEREDFNAAHVGEGYETRTPDDYILTDEQAHVMRCALANYRKACDLCEE